MKAIFLVEKTKRDMWHVVERECTPRGVSATNYRVIGKPFFVKEKARHALRLIKGGSPQPRG